MKTNQLPKVILLFLILLFQEKTFAQMGINATGTPPASNAMLDVSSTTKGVLMPRMTTAQRTALAHTKGLTVFDITTNNYWYSDGSAWIPITNAAAGTGWALSGNNIFNNNTGNVGIGTLTPSTKLAILTTGNSFGLSHSNGVVSMSTYINSFGALLGTSTNHPLQLYTNNQSAQLTLLQNGNVGIGVTSPQSDLHINPNGAGSILIGTNRSTGGYTSLEMGISAQSGGSSFIQSITSAGAANGYGNLQLNPSGGDVTFTGNVGIGTNSPGYPLDIVQADVNSSTAMRILTPGHIWGIGVFTNLFFNHNNITRAVINAVDGHYSSFSDKRLKKNIEEIKPVLDKVLQLKAKNYQFIDSDDSTKKSTGFISQEVIGLFPELVSSSKRSVKDSTLYLTLNYAGFSVIAIKAIQEQQVIIESLRAENKTFNTEMDMLKADNKAILVKITKMQEAIEALSKK